MSFDGVHLFSVPSLKVTARDAQTRLNQDQALLRADVCSRGTLDSFVDIRAQLRMQLDSLSVDDELGRELKELVLRIAPLGQFCKGTKDAALTHISDNLQRAQKVYASLTAQQTHTHVCSLLTTLMQQYRQYQWQLKSSPVESNLGERYQFVLASPSLGIRYLSLEAVNSIVPIGRDGDVVKSLAEGTRPVNWDKKVPILWKVDPSAPLWDYALQVFGMLACDTRSAPTWFTTVQRGESTYYVMPAGAVTGIGFHKILTEYRHYLPLLDRLSFGMGFMNTVFTEPQDEKPDNFQAVLTKDGEGNVISMKLVIIDGDRWGAKAVCQTRDFATKEITHYLDVRSIYYCLPQAYEPIHPQVRQYFSEQIAPKVLLQWLHEMTQANKIFSAFQREGHIPSEKMRDLQLPFLLLPDMISELYARMMYTRDFMRTSGPEATYMDMAKAVNPMVAYFCDLINSRHPNDPNAAFLEIFVRGGPVYEKVMHSFMKQPIIHGQTVQDYLATCNFGAEDFVVRRSLPPEITAELFLSELDFRLFTEEEQKEILDELERFPLSEIAIRHCSALDDTRLNRILRSQPRLRKLTLLNCPRLTDLGIHALATCSRYLDLNILDCAGISPKMSTTYSGYFSHYVLKFGSQPQISTDQLVPSGSFFGHEEGMSDLTAALERKDWALVMSHYSALQAKELEPQAQVKIVENLIKSDSMRDIVQNDRMEVMAYLDSIGFDFSQKNARGETFYHIACELGRVKVLKWLCPKVTNWSTIVNDKMQMPVHVAVAFGQQACLEILIAAGAPLDIADAASHTPLHIALDHRDEPTALMLIQAKCKLDVRDRRNQTPMHLACHNDLRQVLAVLVVQTPTLCSKMDVNGKSPLAICIEFDRVECAKLVIDAMHVTSLDVPQENGITALMEGARFNRKQIVQLLLIRNVNSRLTDSEGMTAAHHAAMGGALPCLQELVGLRPSVEALSQKRTDGKTLLHLAAISGNRGVVAWLCQQRVSLVALDQEEMTPAHCAAAAGQVELFADLVRAGFPINFQDTSKKETCLVFALRGQHLTMAGQMLGLGAKLDLPNVFGFLPIHSAARENNCKAIRWLCSDCKVDVDSKTKGSSQATALHIAAGGGHLEAVQLLLDLRANPNPGDRNNRVPLHLAIQGGHAAVAQTLEARGASLQSATNEGETCLYYAVQGSFPLLVDWILSKQPALLRAQTKTQGHTALHTAMGQESLFEYAKNHKPEEVDAKRRTQIEVLRLLLSYGADVNAKGRGDYTPLHAAVRWARLDFVRFLTDRGARTDIKYNNDLGESRTPAEHAGYLKLASDEQSRALMEIKEYLDGYAQLKISRQKITKFQTMRTQRSLSMIPLQTLLTQLRETKGFRPETLCLILTMSEGFQGTTIAQSQSFFSAFSALNKEWGVAIPIYLNEMRQEAADIRPLSDQEICDQCCRELTPPEYDRILRTLVLTTSVAEVFTRISEFLISKKKSITPEQIKAFCRLISEMFRHEAIKAADFTGDSSAGLVKAIGKPHKREDSCVTTARTLLTSPAASPARVMDHEWKRNQIPARSQAFHSRLARILHSANEIERDVWLEEIVLSLMKMHHQWFMEMRMSDFTPSPVPNSALFELLQTSKYLTSSCMVFVLKESDKKTRLKRVQVLLEWLNKSLLYGDFHQAYSVYNALSHPLVLRLRRTFSKIDGERREQLGEWDRLFSPAAGFRFYFYQISQRLAPIIPAFGIYCRHIEDRREFATIYAVFRNMQEYRIYANRLIVPTPANFEQNQLLLTPELYPAELTLTWPENGYPADSYASRRTLELEPLR